jgi:hypothetical protein
LQATAETMGYNARNDEIRDNVTRMRREWEAQRGALATVRRFNATLSAKGCVWFWPKIAAALTSKHHWLIINCDSCGTVVDLDLRVKPRDPELLSALRSAMCNAHGAMGTAGHASLLWRGPSIWLCEQAHSALTGPAVRFGVFSEG